MHPIWPVAMKIYLSLIVNKADNASRLACCNKNIPISLTITAGRRPARSIKVREPHAADSTSEQPERLVACFVFYHKIAKKKK